MGCDNEGPSALGGCFLFQRNFSSMKWKFNIVQMDQIGGKKKMKQSTAGRYFSKTLKVKVTEKNC